jgi:SAM-dependent methyltransferase
VNSIPDWTRTFFEGPSVELWRRVASPDQNRAEADFILTFARDESERILDVPCGDGRLAIEVARRGHVVTGADISQDSLEYARGTAGKAGVEVAFIEADMRNLGMKDRFDLAFCFGNSFAYFDHDGNASFVRSVYDALTPGGRFLMETNLAAESVLPTVQLRAWYKIEDWYMLANREYDAATSRLRADYTFLHEGVEDTRSAWYHIYLARDIVEMFARVGFTDVQTFGSAQREAFQLGSRALYVAAQKPIVRDA